MKSVRISQLSFVQPIVCIASFAALSACGNAMLPTLSRDKALLSNDASAAGLVPVGLSLQQGSLNLAGTELAVKEFTVRLIGGDACWKSVASTQRDSFKVSSTSQLKVVQNASGCRIELISFKQQDDKEFAGAGGNLTLEANLSKDFTHAAASQVLSLTVIEGLNTATGGVIRINAGQVISGTGSDIAGQQQIITEKDVAVSVALGTPPAITNVSANFTDSQQKALSAFFICSAQATGISNSTTGLSAREWCISEARVNRSDINKQVVDQAKDQKITDYKASLLWLTPAQLKFSEIHNQFTASVNVSAIPSENPIRLTPTGYSTEGTKHTFASPFTVPNRPAVSGAADAPELYLVVQNLDKGLPGYFIWKLNLPSRPTQAAN